MACVLFEFIEVVLSWFMLALLWCIGEELSKPLFDKIANEEVRVKAKATAYVVAVLNASVVVLTSNKFTEGLLIEVLLLLLAIVVMVTSNRLAVFITYTVLTSVLTLIFGAIISLAVLIPICSTYIIKYMIRRAKA